MLLSHSISAGKGERKWMESLIGRDKDRKITHQLSSWAKQTAPTQVQFPPDNLLQRVLSTSCSLLQNISPYCGLGSSLGCSVAMVVHHGMQWDSLLYHVTMLFSKGSKRITAPMTGAHSPPALFTDCSVCRTFFSQSCLSQLLHWTFNQLVKNVITVVSPLRFIDSLLARGWFLLEVAGTSFVWHGGGSCPLLLKAVLKAANTLPCKHNTFIKTICPFFSLVSWR